MSNLQIVSWLVAAMIHWGTPGHGAIEQERQIVAEAIVSVAYDVEEPPLYRGDDGRARTAALLSSIAVHESRLLPRLAQGHCRQGECDSGAASALFQTHMGAYGVVLLPKAGFRYCGAPDPSCVTAEALAGNEALQARTALHWLRQGGIGRYTGEGDVNGPAARRRMESAELWTLRHPVPAKDAEVLSSVPME